MLIVDAVRLSTIISGYWLVQGSSNIIIWLSKSEAHYYADNYADEADFQQS
jgi:hypothetical protein